MLVKRWMNWAHAIRSSCLCPPHHIYPALPFPVGDPLMTHLALGPPSSLLVYCMHSFSWHRPLRAAIPVTGATQAGSAPRPDSLPGPGLGPGPGGPERTNFPCISPVGGHRASIWASLVKGSMLLHKAAECSVRFLCLAIVPFIAWESASQ